MILYGRSQQSHMDGGRYLVWMFCQGGELVIYVRQRRSHAYYSHNIRIVIGYTGILGSGTCAPACMAAMFVEWLKRALSEVSPCML